jgi:hypothetical protein
MALSHVCASPRLLVLIKEIGDTRDTIELLEKEQKAEPDPEDFFLEEFLEISLNAILRSPTSSTMRLVV